MIILLIEDNPGDVRLTQEALRESQQPHQLFVVPDGEEALRYLLKQAPYEEAASPHVILLDLNLPRKNGRELLAEIKQHSRLSHIPVIILTTSDAKEDILKCYGLHANCYITKPVDINQFIDLMHTLGLFWFQTVSLPQDR